MSTINHGGRVFALARRLNCSPAEILDFSASINPIGLPPSVLKAAQEAMENALHYPDPFAEPLVADLADYHRLPSDCLLAGNGATEFIFVVPRALHCQNALVIEPSFGEYAAALRLAGTRIHRLQLLPEQNFVLGSDQLQAALTSDLDLIVLANPGNPAGAAIGRQAMLELLSVVPLSTAVLVDEAFIDFCPQHSIIDQVVSRPNLLVMRSLTKFYAIPGLRVGYLATSKSLAKSVIGYREPWRLSVPAISAARACLVATDYQRRSLRMLPRWRSQLARGLTELSFQVYPSVANYLLCRLPEASPGADTLAEELADQAILIRSCDNFVGLDSRFMRLAVRRPEENHCLLRVLKQILSA